VAGRDRARGEQYPGKAILFLFQTVFDGNAGHCGFLEQTTVS
jgi:hypothetical protein